MRIAYVTRAALLLAMMAAGCGHKEPEGAATEEPAPDATADFDQDGLADVEEIERYHTSPETKDTDGDGYDDYQEIREFGFDPANPTKFNPLVADVPRIDIELTTSPKVTVVYRKSTGEAETVESGETHTRGTTHMTSASTELSSSLSATVGVTGGVSGGLPTSEVSTSITATVSTSLSMTTQNSEENQRALSKMRSKSQNKDLTVEGGQIKVGVAITNTSHIPFTLQNLSLTAFHREGTRWSPIAQLEAESSRAFFEMGTWEPGQRVDDILFKADSLALSEVEEIMTGDLLVRVSKYELKDENNQSFGHRMAAIDAACARVLVDYGGSYAPESYLVSARGTTEAGCVTISAMLDALGISYETGTVAWTYRKRTQAGKMATGDGATEIGQTRHGLLRLRDLGVDPKQGGYWLIIHETPIAPSGSSTRRYDLLAEDYKLEDICLKPRQTIQLAYIRDADHDGLATPAEHALGTDPWQADTDGDGVADGDEILAGTNPLWNNAFPLPGIESLEMGTAGRQVELAITLAAPDEKPIERLCIKWGDGSLADEVLKPQHKLTCSHQYAAFGKYRIALNPYAGPKLAGKTHEIEVSVAPLLVRNLTVQFGTDGLDRLHRLAVDREGNMVLAGTSPEGTFLTKYDDSGERQWNVRPFGRWHVAGGLAIDRAGNVHLAASDSRSKDQLTAYLSEYDTRTGEELRRLGVEDERPMRDLATDESGDIYYYAQERWSSDRYPTMSREIEKRGGAEARERFARLSFGQQFRLPMSGGGSWGTTNSRRPDLQKLWIPANAGQKESCTRETQPRYIYSVCTNFEDEESVVSEGRITWVKVCHGGYIHGLQLGYGCRAGSFHGLETTESGLRVTGWDVPNGEQIVRVEGEIAKNPSGLLYVSRLQFVTDKGTKSPRFGGSAGTAFVAAAPDSLPLRTISGSVDLTRHRSRTRAITGMTFHFGPCAAWNVYLPSDVSVQAIAVDASGSVFACGYRRILSGLDYIPIINQAGPADPSSFLARYDPDGKLGWLRWHGDHEHDISMAVAADGSGNAYVADITPGRTPEKTNRGLFDVRLTKYSPAGEVIWMRQFGTRLNDVAFSVAVWPRVLPGVAPRDAEAIYVAGITQGDLFEETADMLPTSELSAFLAAYDPDGKRTFLQQFPLGAKVPKDVFELRLPKLAGLWEEFVEQRKVSGPITVDATEGRPSEPDGRANWDVMRISWWKMLTVAAVVTTDDSGNVYLAGGSEKSLDPDYTIKGNADIFLMRFARSSEVKR
ncbi:MAG: hypothetical protein JXP34_13890 [Planctomycetes bacterium]|nr:hypothetical protein [Planctomycetota bacterium]